VNARERVLRAYGGNPPHCSWCQSTTNLEIDHVDGGQGQGNAHRKTLTKRIEYWLVDEYRRLGSWPTGYQVLCHGCHDAKSKRRPTMPPRKGNESINLSLPAALVEQLTVLASKPGATRSSVIEEALRAMIEGTASQTLLETLHQRLDAFTAGLTAVEQALKALDVRVLNIESRLRTHEGKYVEFCDAVHRLYSFAATPPNGTTRRSWSSFLTGWKG
jgi:predicted transcriptional regulator